MARISVVVPIYNVEDYLEECLESLAAQTVDDLEVIMVNDGSTDSSEAIAARWAERDPRFKLISQPNGGLSAARNAGLAQATGEFLAFADSDDVVPRDGYARLLGALDETGSDFATGNIRRLTNTGTLQARMLASAFTETRLKTHVTKHPALIADRVAANKLWRRSFWDANGYRFPEGVMHEDIHVVLPAHFKARSVDVISECTYLWRRRQSGAPSLTQRRTEIKALVDRLDAVEAVSAYLHEHGPRNAASWYDQSLVADDLMLHLTVLDRVDDEYRRLFLDRVNALLDRADDDVYEPLAAIDRLKWYLVRRRLMDELLEVLRFEREELVNRPPVEIGGRFYGDYPFRGDERLKIPLTVYELRRELALRVRLDGLSREDGRLRADGIAFIEGIGAPSEGFQEVEVRALRPGPLRRLRYALTGARFDTRPVHRPDANSDADERLADVSWAGFTATLPPGRLRRLPRWRDGSWDLNVTVSVGKVRRRRMRFSFSDVTPLGTVELISSEEALVRAQPTDERGVVVRVQTAWASALSARVEEGVLELEGRLHVKGAENLALELRGAGGAKSLKRKLAVEGDRFRARVPLDALAERAGHTRLADEDAEELTEDPTWELYLGGGGQRVRVTLPQGSEESVWPCAGRQLALVPVAGDASLVLRAPRIVITDARWLGGDLELEGTAPTDEPVEVLAGKRWAFEPFVFEASVENGRFRTRIPAAHVRTLAGDLPLREGRWELFSRPVGNTDVEVIAPLMPTPQLRARLPLKAEVERKEFRLVRTRDRRAVINVTRDLAEDERGRFQQRRLAETAYRARRGEPLRETVVYTSFRGRQCSDSPRAIQEELVRRGAPLEHLWVVRDRHAEVPPGARLIPEGSRAHYEALARSRYVVNNDHFPQWFERREDQMCVQTWHGTPLKRLGYDVPRRDGRARNFEQTWGVQRRNWQYVVSPNRFSTPILRDAYDLDSSEMLETGYPRDDVLARRDRDEASRELRARLGIPEGVRTVLYAPTFRDHVRDRRGRYRLDLHLDLERLRDALGPDTVLLFRKHHYVADPVPSTADGFVRDVSQYPDGTELLLAADVLVTDYSAMAVDYANTRRPMLFFTYDFDSYQEEIRGFYVPYEETVPGPLLQSTDEVIEALRDLDAVAAAHQERYERFVEQFCELDDGGASARVVDRIFETG